MYMFTLVCTFASLNTLTYSMCSPFQFLRRIARQDPDPRMDEEPEERAMQKDQAPQVAESQEVYLVRHPNQWEKIRSVRTPIAL
jgi:hypothetical protein